MEGGLIEEPAPATIRAVYEVDPPGCGALVAGRAAGSDPAFATVVETRGGRAVLDFPAGNWGRNVALLHSALIAGEAMELAALRRCRLVELHLPDGLLPGPRLGATAAPGVAVGVIVKPALGLDPRAVADVARAAVAGGARLVKDDEVLGDPAWCPLDARIAAVAQALEPGVVYCPNVTGPSTTLLDRARRAVDLGATGLMVTFAQGLEAILALRDADLGVPLYVHRAGTAPLVRNERFGATGAVLARLTRLCGADFVVAGGFGGSLHDPPGDVRANLDAIRGAAGTAAPAIPVIGGATAPGDVAALAGRAGGAPLAIMLGSRAYEHPGGLEAGVRAAVTAIA